MIRYLFVLNNKTVFCFKDQFIYWFVKKPSIAIWNNSKTLSTIWFIMKIYLVFHIFIRIKQIYNNIFVNFPNSIFLVISKSYIACKSTNIPFWMENLCHAKMDGYKINANKNVIYFSTNKMCKVYTLCTLVCHSHQGYTNIKDIRVAK